FGRQIEPGDGVKADEKQADYVHRHHNRIHEEILHSQPSLRTIDQRVDLHQRLDHEPGYEHAADLAQDELEIRPTPQPPVSGHADAIALRRITGVSRHHLPPHGINSDLTHSS